MTDLTDHFTARPFTQRQPPAPPQTTVLGVAVGDLSVPPALCAVRYTQHLVSPGDPLCGEPPEWETQYTLLGSESLDAGAGYPLVARRVNQLAQRLYNRDQRGDYHVLVDASGIGMPVVAAIRDAIIPRVHVTGVSIGSGDKGDLSILWRFQTSVGLAYLISRLQAILQGGRLRVPGDPASQRLLDLLRDYDLSRAASADMVRALALATASEYMPLKYLSGFDSIPSPAL